MVGRGAQLFQNMVIDYNYGGTKPVRFFSADQEFTSGETYGDRFEYIGKTGEKNGESIHTQQWNSTQRKFHLNGRLL